MPDILRTDQDGIVKLVFDRPTKRNAINAEMYEALAQAIDDLSKRDDLHVLLIAANGDYFSSGTDIGLVAQTRTESAMEMRRHYRENARHWLYDQMEALEKPVVVAHQALCLGGGLELSLSCDFRLASENARYQMPEINLGMIAGSGGTSRLTRLVGPHWARWILMASEPVDAAQALNMGLVHAVYPAAQFEEKTWAFCKKLASLPPETLAAYKLAIELSVDLDRSQARNVERLTNSSLYFGKEHQVLMAEIVARYVRPKAKG